MIRFLIIIIISTSNLYSKNTYAIEIKNLFVDEKYVPAFDVFTMNSTDSEKLGYFSWVFANEVWAEAYGGLTYMPTSYFQIGVGIGIEKADNPLRIGSMIWVGKQNWSVLTLLENGGSGYWHQINAIYRFNKNIGIGFMKEEFNGFGPRLEFSFSNLPVQVWTSFLQLDGNLNTYFTIKFLL